MDRENFDKYTGERNNLQAKGGSQGSESLVGIRKTLNDMGFKNDRIGFNDKDKTVTLGGRTLMRPTYLDDEAGVSYASASDIQKSLVDFYKGSKNPIVRVSDAYAAAAGKYGLTADALSYGNGTVSLGGRPLDVLYIDDSGKAWAWNDNVINAVSRYADKAGVRSPDSIANEYSKKYLSDIINAVDDIRNRDEFSYNPEQDPVYIAYRNKYLLEGNRASENAAANYSALTGGYMNSAAATAGALANQYYAQQLANTVPELAQQAYDRYYSSYKLDMEVLDRMMKMYDSGYKTAQDANSMTRQNTNAAASSVVQRDNAAYERALAESERYSNDMRNRQEYETQERENYWNEALNSQKLIENSYKNEGYRLDNEQQQIYLEYYRRLLDAEYAGGILKNEKTEAEIARILSEMYK